MEDNRRDPRSKPKSGAPHHGRSVDERPVVARRVTNVDDRRGRSVHVYIFDVVIRIIGRDVLDAVGHVIGYFPRPVGVV